MARPSPDRLRQVVYTVLTAIVIAAITGASKLAYDGKLDVPRFERDSITVDYKFQRVEGLLNRIDSTTRRTDARVERLEARR